MKYRVIVSKKIKMKFAFDVVLKSFCRGVVLFCVALFDGLSLTSTYTTLTSEVFRHLFNVNNNHVNYPYVISMKHNFRLSCMYRFLVSVNTRFFISNVRVNLAKKKLKLSNTLRLNFCYLKIIHFRHPCYHPKIIDILKIAQKTSTSV